MRSRRLSSDFSRLKFLTVTYTAIVPPKQGVRRSKDGHAVVEVGDDAGLGDTDRLLHHDLVGAASGAGAGPPWPRRGQKRKIKQT